MPPGRHERAKKIIADVLACPLETGTSPGVVLGTVG